MLLDEDFFSSSPPSAPPLPKRSNNLHQSNVTTHNNPIDQKKELIDLLLLIDEDPETGANALVKPDLLHKHYRHLPLIPGFTLGFNQHSTPDHPTNRGCLEFSCPHPGVWDAGRLMAWQGKVTRVGLGKVRIAQKTWACPRCSWRGVYYADDRMHGLVPEPTACPHVSQGGERCGYQNLKEEDTAAGPVVYEDVQECRLQEPFEAVRFGRQPRSIPVVLIGASLKDAARPGDDVLIIGVLQCRLPASSSYSKTLKLEGDFVLVASHVSKAHTTSQLPSNLPLEVDFCTGKELMDTAVASLAPHLYGLQREKLAILLTLIGAVSVSRPSSHLLLVGPSGMKWFFFK